MSSNLLAMASLLVRVASSVPRSVALQAVLWGTISASGSEARAMVLAEFTLMVLPNPKKYMLHL